MSKLSKTLESRIARELYPCLMPVEIANISIDIGRVDLDSTYAQKWVVEAKWKTEFQVSQNSLANDRTMIEKQCIRIAKQELNETVFGEFRLDLINLQKLLIKYGYDSEGIEIVQDMERRMFNE
jgi:hypothetical protein